MAIVPTSAADVAAVPHEAKFKFVAEYSINASARLLFPYLSTAGSLAQWFCDDVKLTPDHLFNFIWDGEAHYAAVTNLRQNRSIRFVFLSLQRQPLPDPGYIDFTLESSELTLEQYLRVTDYSEEHDKGELQERWDGLVQTLREQVGG
ncbi:MAG: ATPase [Hymenobacteraceae bacterium]|nr:ATPase [Hymenobacteraceae bacterium]